MIIAAELLKKLLVPNPVGWVEGLDDESYHSDKSAVNFSSLKHADKSLYAFAKSYWGGGKRETDAMKFGKLAHMALLEGAKFKARYVVMPEFTGLTAKGEITTSKNATDVKNKIAAWTNAQSPDALIVTEDERTKLFNMIESVLSNEEASKLLSQGKPEIAGYWTDEETGLNLRFKPDFLAFGLGVLADVKTTPDIRWEMFRKSVENHRYDLQMMMYSEGVKNITKVEPEHRAWIAIESDGAHEVRVHEVNGIYQECGAFDFRRLLRKVKTAIDSGKFPQGLPREEVNEIPTTWYQKKYIDLGVLEEMGGF